MNRREFLKTNAQMLAFLSASSALTSKELFFPNKTIAKPATPDVSIIKASPAVATRAAVEALGGMSLFVKKGDKVVIKPNMSFAQGVDSATTTHPEVVKELVILCKEAGASSIRVLDHGLQNLKLSMENSGILAACNSVEEGICHQIVNEDFYAEMPISQALDMKENAFMKDVLEADVIIAAPVAKSHSSAGVSLSLKGQMGLIYSRWVMHVRYDLATAIVDLNTLVKPHLSIIDATRVLTTNGPGGPGKVISPKEVIASADPVAADATAISRYEWYGRKILPRQVAYIKMAHERGLGRMDIENLNVVELAL